MSHPEIRNEMILASAGSGKTYQLTNRFIGLMASGVPPERIIALTFTRKAAGEFFEAILKKLADAATDPDACAQLTKAIDNPVLTQRDYGHYLERLVANMHRLHLGTLDSFFVRIIQSFPFEFGLGGGFEIIGDHELAKAKSRVYQRVFHRGAKNSSRAQFLQSFKESTYGQEEASLLSVLDKFIENHHELFLEAPERAYWGNPEKIWPGRSGKWSRQIVDLHAPFEQLFEALSSQNLSAKQLDRWHDFRDAVLSHEPGAPLAGPIKYLLSRLAEPGLWQDIQLDQGTLKTDSQSLELSPEICEELRTIIPSIIAAEYENKMRRTAGIWEVIAHYESQYSQAVRRRGKLTFFDLQLILSGHDERGASRRLHLTQTPDSDARLRIDYRLDSKFDHWLLDEFQDTNFHQWSVVQNLIDEAVQDVSGERSLFQVGDIKQAIYAWRGGDVRLFKEIRDYYNHHETRIFERPLNTSFRSGPAVISMLNQVFGQGDILTKLFPKAAVDRWDWTNHKSEKQNLTGTAQLLHPLPVPSKPKAGLEFRKALARHELALGVLDSVKPAEKRLTCAILVQSNKQCHAITDYIRAHSDHQVFDESDTTVADDSPAAGALLSLLRSAAHPGDTLASGHVKMSPLAKIIASMGIGEAALIRKILRDISDRGFEHFFRTWLRLLRTEAGVQLDPFNHRRVEQLAEAAQVFDADGDRDIDAFLQFAASYTVRDAVAPGVIQVMTIHKSKGLGFDVVILPELQGQSLAQPRKGIGVKRAENRDIEWILEIPSKEIANADPEIRRYREAQEADACYEEFCKLYVALTRAKRALYIITDPAGNTESKSTNFPKLLNTALSMGGPDPVEIGDVKGLETYAKGDPGWHSNLHDESGTKSESERPKPEPAPLRTFPPRPHLPRRTPSGSESHSVSSYDLFSRSGKRARDFGTAVHALFEEIEWSDDQNGETLRERFRTAPIPEAIRDEAESHVLRCLESPEAQHALTKPSPDAAAWLERKFELVLNGEWISGTFDRVVVEPDKATILDFKTDRVTTDEEIQNAIQGYRPQLTLYRQVLNRLTGLPPESIRTSLLFTRPRRVVEV